MLRYTSPHSNYGFSTFSIADAYGPFLRTSVNISYRSIRLLNCEELRKGITGLSMLNRAYAKEHMPSFRSNDVISVVSRHVLVQVAYIIWNYLACDTYDLRLGLMLLATVSYHIKSHCPDKRCPECNRVVVFGKVSEDDRWYTSEPITRESWEELVGVSVFKEV